MCHARKPLIEYGNQASIQASYLLLRYCAEPKVAHLLRVAEPELIREAAIKHDAAIQDGLSCLLGGGDLLRLDGTDTVGRSSLCDERAETEGKRRERKERREKIRRARSARRHHRVFT